MSINVFHSTRTAEKPKPISSLWLPLPEYWHLLYLMLAPSECISAVIKHKLKHMCTCVLGAALLILLFLSFALLVTAYSPIIQLISL